MIRRDKRVQGRLSATLCDCVGLHNRNSLLFVYGPQDSQSKGIKISIHNMQNALNMLSDKLKRDGWSRNSTATKSEKENQP